jgi:hypothetical protein
MFYLDVVKVDLIFYMLQWLYMYFASVRFNCFSCFRHMLLVFYLDIAYIAVDIHVCCKCIFQMCHLFHTYVASISTGCCICCIIAYVLDICCKRLFKIFHLFQTYVVNVFIWML